MFLYPETMYGPQWVRIRTEDGPVCSLRKSLRVNNHKPTVQHRARAMFLYLIRNVYHGLDALRLPALSILDTARVTLRVRPFDLDYNLHQNNARYLESFEMARFSMIVRTGIFKAMIDKRTSICYIVCCLTVRRSDARCGGSLCAVHCAAPPLGKVRGDCARGGMGRAVALHGADDDQVRIDSIL